MMGHVKVAQKATERAANGPSWTTFSNKIEQ